jgi:protease-4
MSNGQTTVPPPIPPQYYPTYRRKSRWWIPVVIVVGVLAIIFILIFALFGSLMSPFEKESYEVKSNSVLYLDMGKVLNETCQKTPFSFMGNQCKASFPEVLDAIKTAKTDKRIKGIYYKAEFTQMGYAKSKEIQDALNDFKSSGKFIYAYMDVCAEPDYFRALPADKIFMPPEGMAEMNGFGATSIFLKGMLDKIGINFYVLGFEDFKSAGESLSRRNFSDSARKQIQVILDQRLNMFLDGVVQYRKMDRKLALDALNRGIFMADSMKALGFIDDFAQEADVKEMMKEQIYGKVKSKEEHKLRLVGIEDYLSDKPETKQKIADKSKQIAIIYAEGTVSDDMGSSPFDTEKKITTSAMVKYLRKAREDKDVKVIILRINSPGGSVITSDAIREEIIKTKKVKPIYASMSDVAASGGYYIPMACDTIIANPATITGSIGVILAVPNLSGLMNKLDLSPDTISTGPAAQTLNGLIPMQEKDKKMLYTAGKSIYDRFIGKVALHRHKTFEQIHALAKGRVWTGEDAYKNGLVDVLGGYQTAIDIAKRRIGIPDSVKALFKVYPEPEDPFEALLKMFGVGKHGEDDEHCSSWFGNVFSKLFGVPQNEIGYFYEALPDGLKHEVNYMFDLLGIARREKVMMAMPYYIDEN